MTTQLTGRQLGNYVLGPLIGRGGMGEVYAASHRFLGTEVAVKTLRGVFADNESVAHRFFLEARAAVEIAHPNVVRVLDFGKADDDTLYLVMERLHGRSLAAEIAYGPIPVANAVYVATLVCAGLSAAHGKGIIHRDLKPDNVFLTDDSVKILDFGIARVLSQVSATSQGAVIGTPLYMAPEQTRASQNAGPASDVYSLGAMLFEMITGRPPFIGETASQLIASHLFEAPPKVRQFFPIERKLDKIIERCLSKTPEARPQSMGELAELLAPYVPAVPALPPRRVQIDEVAHPLAMTDDLGVIGTADPQGHRAGSSSTLSGAASEHRAQFKNPHSTSAAMIGIALALSGVGVAALLWVRTPKVTPVVKVAQPVAPAMAQLPVAIPPPAVVLEDVVLRTDPPGAIASADGAVLGNTPLAIKHTVPLTVTFALRGYHDEVAVIHEAGEHTTKFSRLHHEHATKASTPTATPTSTPTRPGEGLD